MNMSHTSVCRELGTRCGTPFSPDFCSNGCTAYCSIVEQGRQVPEAKLLAAEAEAAAAAAAAVQHRGEVARLRAELDGLNRQLEQTCTLRLQPSDASDSQVCLCGAPSLFTPHSEELPDVTQMQTLLHLCMHICRNGTGVV